MIKKINESSEEQKEIQNYLHEVMKKYNIQQEEIAKITNTSINIVKNWLSKKQRTSIPPSAKAAIKHWEKVQEYEKILESIQTVKEFFTLFECNSK